ncbi:hypothetical protein LCGC14_0323060 [marine sediment metagenome]|uniref:Uncharacterized protein n=1 Tax=marine sediment metagenome TaxID=412755 RepID=A0A0F9U1A4_9ZZZZ
MAVATATNKKMTEADYRVRRTQIDEQVEAKEERVKAYGDQELAKLFWASGWLQKELASQEGKSEPWVCCRLRFGSFLNWLESEKFTARKFQQVVSKNLTEFRFRSYWEQTSGTKDTARFRNVWKMMQDETQLVHPREKTRDIITKKCDPHEWYAGQEIQELTGLTEKQVANATQRMYDLGLCETKQTAHGLAYRIRKGEGRTKIDTAWLKQLRKDADALIRSIIKSATGDEARYSATGVAIDAGKLKDLMNELKERITPSSA